MGIKELFSFTAKNNPDSEMHVVSGNQGIPAHISAIATGKTIEHVLKTYYPQESSPEGIRRTPATSRIFSRLSESDIDRVLSAIRSEIDPALAKSLEVQRSKRPAAFRRGIIRYGNVLLPEELNAKTGVVLTDPPPEDVPCFGVTEHWCGDFSFCDLVAEAVEDAGMAFRTGARYLDFGCQSGRVVRTLAAAYPESEWHGCDPQSKAIDWASTNIPTVRFFQSNENPPLAYADGELAGAYAMSVWSHFSARAAKWWFDEMHRVIEPGGWLVFSTLGLHSCQHLTAKKPPKRMAEILNVLVHDGFCLHRLPYDEWKFDATDWGNAFMLPVWVMRTCLGKWSIRFFRVGMYNGNQDVYLLERLPATVTGSD